MKIAFFILSQSIYREQIQKFFSVKDELNIPDENIIIFEKAPRKRRSSEVFKQGFFQKARQITGKLNRDLPFKIKFLIRSKLFNWSAEMKKRKIRIYSLHDVNSEATHAILRKEQIDIGIFIYYDQIIRKDTLGLIRHPVNIHNALLPEYRGCQPLFWQLLEKRKVSCISMHRMIGEIDAGDIIFELPYTMNHHRGYLYNLLRTFEPIHLLLYMGLRRLLLFREDFGIPQDQFRGAGNYYKCPDRQQLRLIK